MSKAAIVLGSTGSVGKAVIAELLRDGSFDPIITLVRQPQQVAGVREIVVPTMSPAALEAATREAITGETVGLSALGVGAGTGKLTIDEHRAVDVELNAAFARGLQASRHVTHLAFLSVVGANPAGKTTGSGAAGMGRYSRVKGEAEEAVKASGLAVVSMFRPATIIGSQHTPWLLGKIAPVFNVVLPARYRSITVDQIARAMVATSRTPPASSAVYEYREMRALSAP